MDVVSSETAQILYKNKVYSAVLCVLDKPLHSGAVNKLPVPTKEGYTFEGWLDPEDNLVTEDTIYTFTSDVVYTASWKAVVSGSTDSSDTGICLVIFAVLFILIICAVVIALILKNRKKRLSK